MTEIRFTVLDVGQGSGNFVEIYDGDDLLTTILLDFGSQQSGTAGIKASVDYIVGKLQENARMAALVLSHKDNDHVSLLPDLFERCNDMQNPVPLKIDGIFYSGAIPDYNRADGNIIALARQFLSTDNRAIGHRGFPYNWTQQKKDTNGNERVRTFWPWKNKSRDARLAPVSLSVLKVNVDESKMGKIDGKYQDFKKHRRSGINANAASLVTLLSLKQTGGREDCVFIITGDATNATMRAASRKKINDIRNRDVFHITTPHHGSLTTAVSSSKKQKKRKQSDDDPDPYITRFARKLRAKTLSTSADQKYKHPHIELLRYFMPYLSPEYQPTSVPDLPEGRHFMTVWVEVGNVSERPTKFQKAAADDPFVEWDDVFDVDGYKSLQTTLPVFTTRYIADKNKRAVAAQNYLYEFGDDQPDTLEQVVDDDGDPFHSLAPADVNWRFVADDDGGRVISYLAHDELMQSVMLGLPAPEPTTLVRLAASRAEVAITRKRSTERAVRRSSGTIRVIG